MPVRFHHLPWIWKSRCSHVVLQMTSSCHITIWVCVETPGPFKLFFQTLSVFFLPIVFPSAGFTPWSKNSHERGKEKGIVKEGKVKNRKGRGKGKEKERERKKKAKGNRREKERKRKHKRKGKRTGKRKGEGKGRVKEETGKRTGKGEEKGKKGSVSHGPFLMPKVIVFVIVLLSFVNPVCVPFFLEMAAVIKKGV